jgi:hypothetical protein
VELTENGWPAKVVTLGEVEAKNGGGEQREGPANRRGGWGEEGEFVRSRVRIGNRGTVDEWVDKNSGGKKIVEKWLDKRTACRSDERKKCIARRSGNIVPARVISCRRGA